MSEHPTDFVGSVEDAITSSVKDRIPDAVVSVSGGGGHFRIDVVSAAFRQVDAREPAPGAVGDQAPDQWRPRAGPRGRLADDPHSVTGDGVSFISFPDTSQDRLASDHRSLAHPRRSQREVARRQLIR